MYSRDGIRKHTANRLETALGEIAVLVYKPRGVLNTK